MGRRSIPTCVLGLLRLLPCDEDTHVSDFFLLPASSMRAHVRSECLESSLCVACVCVLSQVCCVLATVEEDGQLDVRACGATSVT